MSLTISRQIKAARVLVGWEQKDLADQADVAINTVRRMEGADGPVRGNIDTVRKIQAALETAGIEFLNHGEPGVRLRKVAPPDSKT